MRAISKKTHSGVVFWSWFKFYSLQPCTNFPEDELMHRTLLAVIWPINSCIIVPTQGAETIIYIQPVMATAQGVFSATVSPGLKLPSIIKMIQGTSVQTSKQEIVEKEQHWDHRKVWCITNVHSINEHFHHKMRSRQHKALTCHSLMYLIEQVWCALPHGSAIDLLQFVDFFRLQISFFIGGHYCPTQFVVKHNVVFPSDFWDGLTLLLSHPLLVWSSTSSL